MFIHDQQRLEFFQRDEQEEVDILFLGDSLIERFDTGTYFPEYRTANRGIDGDTVSGVLRRFDESLNVAVVHNHILLIGINDTLDACKHYETLMKRVRERYQDAKIFALALLPVGGVYSEYNRTAIKANAIIQDAAKKCGATFLNARPILQDEDGELKEEFTVDGVHLNSQGYEKLAEFIRNSLL